MRKRNKLIYGVGVNDSDYPVYSTVAGKVMRCPFYSRWMGMLERAYSIKHHEKSPTYKGCSVHPDWLRFSTFKSWMETQDWEGMHLDKDIIVEGNKVYSPETCVFVTRETNAFVLENASRRGDLPVGVYLKKDRPRQSPYNAQVSVNGKRKLLGDYATPEEAHQAWRVAKHELAIQLASEQNDKRVSEALIKRYIKE